MTGFDRHAMSPAAAMTGSGDASATTAVGADVAAGERVARLDRALDVGAVGARRVTALPLVYVADRLRPGPASRRGGEQVAVLRDSADGRGRRARRRARLNRGPVLVVRCDARARE